MTPIWKTAEQPVPSNLYVEWSISQSYTEFSITTKQSIAEKLSELLMRCYYKMKERVYGTIL